MPDLYKVSTVGNNTTQVTILSECLLTLNGTQRVYQSNTTLFLFRDDRLEFNLGPNIVRLTPYDPTPDPTILDKFKIALGPEEVERTDDGVLQYCLDIAEWALLNRMYYGEQGDKKLPEMYQHVHIQAAIAIYTKRGAEGQTAHTENGTQRTYDSGDIPLAILQQVPTYASTGYVKQ